MANATLTEDKPEGLKNDQGAWCQSGTLVITNDVATTGVIDYARFRGGSFIVPTGAAGATFTFYAKTRRGGTFRAAHTDAEPPVAITRTVAADKHYVIPVDLIDAYAILILSDQAGPITLNVCLKTA